MNVNSKAAYFSQCSDGTPTGNILDLTMGYNSGADNGNVASWSAVGQQTFNRTYSYDSLNRIQSMADSATNQPCQGMSWTIDAWGNMTNQTGTKGTCNNFSSSVGTNNQLQSGYTYDAAGNMTYDGFHYYTYDAENRITAVDNGSTASYVYNENGLRVRKNMGSSFTEYIYDPKGVVQEEWNGTSWPYQYVYAGNRLIAEYTNTTTKFIQSDHLGSTRLVTGVSKVVQDNMDYLPFGQQIAGDTSTTHKFTGKERDGESGLDNFGARYFASTMGRFMSPDWAARPTAVPYAVFGDPQSLNLYTYVRNDPVTQADADGHDSDQSGKDEKQTSGCADGPGGGCQVLAQSSQDAPAQNQSNGTERIMMGIEGAANLFVAKEKAEVTLGLALATPESGPAIAATATAATLGTISTLSSAMTGTAQIVGAITGKTEEANKAAEGLAASTSVSGFITTVVTGDTKKGATAASVEGIFTGSVKRDLFKSPGSIVDAAVNIIDLVSPLPSPPRPPVPGPPPTQ